MGFAAAFLLSFLSFGLLGYVLYYAAYPVVGMAYPPLSTWRPDTVWPLIVGAGSSGPSVSYRPASSTTPLPAVALPGCSETSRTSSCSGSARSRPGCFVSRQVFPRCGTETIEGEWMMKNVTLRHRCFRPPARRVRPCAGAGWRRPRLHETELPRRPAGRCRRGQDEGHLGAGIGAVRPGKGPRQEPRPAGTRQRQVGQGRRRGFLPAVGEATGRRRALPEGGRPGDRRPEGQRMSSAPTSFRPSGSMRGWSAQSTWMATTPAKCCSRAAGYNMGQLIMAVDAVKLEANGTTRVAQSHPRGLRG